MRMVAAAALSTFVLVAPAWSAPGGVRLSLHDGRVSIVATDATVAEILAEWAKQGRTQVSNLDLVPRDRITIELNEVTEERALAVVLRRVSGYVAARRETDDPALSRFDRILVMRGGAPPPLPAARPAAVVPPAADDASGDAKADDQADPDQDPETLTTPDRPKADVNPAGGKPTDQGPSVPGLAFQAVPGRTSSGQRSPAQIAADEFVPDPVPVDPFQAMPAPTVRFATPPPRAFTSGQAAERRAAAPPRDQPIVPRPVGESNPAIDATGLDEAPPPPPGGVVIPPDDPAAQAAFKKRRAVETVDPRTVDFKMPPTKQKAPAAGGPAVGATVPGVTVPATPAKPDPVVIK